MAKLLNFTQLTELCHIKPNHCEFLHFTSKTTNTTGTSVQQYDQSTQNSGFVANSKYKIQALLKDPNSIFQAPKLSTKSHILDMDVQNSDCNVTLKCTVLYSPIP